VQRTGVGLPGSLSRVAASATLSVEEGGEHECIGIDSCFSFVSSWGGCGLRRAFAMAMAAAGEVHLG